MSAWTVHTRSDLALCWGQFDVFDEMPVTCVVTCGPDGTDDPADFSDDHPHRNALWQRYQTALALEHARMVRAGQVHGTRVAVVEASGCVSLFGATDALCTHRTDIALMLLGADCPLVAVYAQDPAANTRAVGVAHAGWRGAFGNITAALVQTMQHHYAMNPADMTAAISPCICPACFEVDIALGQRFTAECPAAAGAVFDDSDRPDKAHIDLTAVIRRQLLDAGLPSARIASANVCTMESPHLHSYRRRGAAAGRHALIAALR